MPAQNEMSMTIRDGIIAWFDGPEWDDVALKAMKEAEDRILSFAKANAPWADRTGLARERLTTYTSNDDGTIILELYHGVDYGLWLETIQSGRFATIMPTLESYAPFAFSMVTAAVRSARRGSNL